VQERRELTTETSSPIGDVDTVDVVGVRNDGGLDLALCAGAALDASPETLSRLDMKLRNYIKAALSEGFLREYGCSAGAPVTIHISCAHPVADAARDLLRRLREEAVKNGIGFDMRSNLSDVH
jgi:hypothetical protein